MRKICIITGTRAEWGLLSRLATLIQSDPDCKLQLVVTNMHLIEKYGYTIQEIEQDGFAVDYRVPMEAKGDKNRDIVHSMSQAMSGFADAYEALKPDLIVILGDRYEMLMAASVALMYKIPIAHLYGGEITEGAYDDAIRHAITKMSHIHFTSTETYRNRVIQLGENPEMVFNVGALGVENIKKTTLLTKNEFEKSINFQLNNSCFLVTFHPVTLDDTPSEIQFGNLLKALEAFPDFRYIFTYPNSDTNGLVIIDMITDYIKRHPDRSIAIPSLGKIRYLSSLQYMRGVIGNSSSGIVEVPSFGIPTLNIGKRQKGRIAADSVLTCSCNTKEIEKGLREIISKEFLIKARNVKNPYEKEDSSISILKELKGIALGEINNKSFFDYN